METVTLPQTLLEAEKETARYWKQQSSRCELENDKLFQEKSSLRRRLADVKAELGFSLLGNVVLLVNLIGFAVTDLQFRPGTKLGCGVSLAVFAGFAVWRFVRLFKKW